MKYILSIFIFLIFPLYLFAVSPNAQEEIDLANSLAKQAFSYYEQGHYSEAEPLFKRSLEIREKVFGPEHPDVARNINNLAGIYISQGRYSEAEPLFKRSLAIHEKVFGPEHPHFAKSLHALANLYYEKGHYNEAEQLYKRALGINEKAFGLEHPEVAKNINKMGYIYIKQGHYDQAGLLIKRALAINEKAFGLEHPEVSENINTLGAMYLHLSRFTEAEPLLKRALVIHEKVFGPEHPKVALSFKNLASLYSIQGNYNEAEPLLKRALDIRVKVFGPEHPDVAESLSNLAHISNSQGNYDEAEQLYKRALAIREEVFGPENPIFAHSLISIAGIYSTQGHYNEAEKLYKRALAINEKVFGLEDHVIATIQGNLASNYKDQGRYNEAEQLHKRALAIKEKVFGPEHQKVAGSLNNLAIIFDYQGRFKEAEQLYKRALLIDENVFGPEHPDVSTSLSNLAGNYSLQGRFKEAEQLYKRALVIDEKVFGPEHPYFAISLSNLASISTTQGNYNEAEQLHKRALAIKEKVFGPEHPDVATNLNNLALLYHTQGNYNEAELLFKRSLEILEKFFGPENPKVASSLINLGLNYYGQGRYKEALAASRRFTDIYLRRFSQGFGELTKGAWNEQQKISKFLLFHLEFISREMQSKQFSTSSASEGFKISQLVTRTRTNSTLNRLGARLAAGEGKLAKDVRSYQDLFDQHEIFEELLFKELGQNARQTKDEKIKNLRIQLEKLESSLNDLKRRLNQDFPDYSALVRPQPLALKDVAKLLSPNEALLKFVVESDMTYIWFIRQNEWALNRIKLGEEELSRLIYELRQSFKPQLNEIKPFDLKAAAYLYDVLLKPSETLLTDIENLIIVTDGALGSLPFGLLVKGMVQESEGESSYEPNTIASRGLDGEDNQLQSVTNDPSESRNTAYRKANWLGKEYNFTTIPSVSSLNTLRGKANTVSKAPEPFLGFGDPLLTSSKDDTHKSDVSSLYPSSKDDPHKPDQSSSVRGAVADVEEVRKLFYRLPETAQELQTIARTLGAPKESVFLREEATEKKVKSMDLNNARIIAFATHGLISGEMKGLAEPALVLTPPEVGSLEDDGLLTASEIAQLKLDADLVILSACNTASSDGKPGAEGLSGLARSFFYAGARSLLVSHWPVESESAMKLTTGMFTELAEQPGIGRAEALKLAQLSLIQDDKNPKFAHPFYWAPFVVVGEGGVWNP